MKFQRGNSPKETLLIGEYADPLKVVAVYHEIFGGMTTQITFPHHHAEDFLTALSKGIQPIATNIRIPGGELREKYRIVVEYGIGDHQYASDIRGQVVQYEPTGRIFKIPHKLKEKTIIYDMF